MKLPSILSLFAVHVVGSLSSKKGSGVASACECVKVPSFEEAVRSFPTVLRIKVKKVKPQNNENRISAKVKKVFKGSDLPSTLSLVVDKEATSCGFFDFRKNNEYVILPTSRNDTELAVHQCGWNGMWQDLPRSKKDFLNLQLIGNPAFNIRTPDSDPLPATIRLFEESVAEGYTSCNELENDLEQFMRFYASNRILHNTRNAIFLEGEWMVPVYPNFLEPDLPPLQTDEAEDSYYTNNQIDGVDEADIVKSDGVFVYVAYGDALIIWNASTGEEVVRIVMPSPADVALRRAECDEAPMEETPRCTVPRSLDSNATIEGLLLRDNRLVLVVSGYRYNYFPYLDQAGAAPADAILSDNGSTHLRVYDTSTLGTDGVLTLLGTKDIQGRYEDGRSIRRKGHVVTSTNVEAEKYLDSFLERSFNPRYRGMNNTAYETAAIAIAKEIIPVAASRIVQELNSDGLECRNVLKLAAYTTADFGQDLEGFGEITSDDTRRSLESVMGFGTVVLLTSLDLKQKFRNATTNGSRTSTVVDLFSGSGVATIVTASSAAFFTKLGPSIITSSKSRMILASNGHHWNERSQTLELRTFLLTFSLPSGKKDGPATPFAVGAVDGHPINSYSLDEHDGKLLRIGTTQLARTCPAFNTTYFGDGPVHHCLQWSTVSQVRNRVFILQYDSSRRPPTMSPVGQTRKLGKRGERLLALRLQGDKAFAATARRTDPFYTLDLSDPTAPRKMGKLEMSGYSNHLHVIENGKFVLAVGEETNEQGNAVGLAVSLFDVRNFETPLLAARHVVEESDDIWSSSEASFDTKAWRFLPESKAILLPMKMQSDTPSDDDKSADGFLILDVDTERSRIEPRFLIDHMEGMEENACYSSSYLPSRSLVFDNKATTIKGHVVVSTDLSTAERRWMLYLDENEPAESNCHSWFP